MRRGAALVATTLAASPVAAGARPAQPPIARPNPVLFGVRLDYVNPLRTPLGAPAVLRPLDPAVTDAAVRDQQYLAYRLRDDLGGFVPAPVGGTFSRGGHDVVGRHGRPEIPLYAQSGGGGVSSFTPTGEAPPTTPPENGRQPVSGLGVPPPVPPPTNNNGVPPPNQGFGGKPGAGSGGQGTTTTPTTTRPKPPPPPPTTTPTPTPTTPTTTTTPATTTTTTATTTATTTTSTTPSGGGSCGTTGLTIVSDHASCVLYAVNMAPGDSTSEVMTITNDSGAPFTLALKASGSQNRLWQDLEMGVWEQGTAPPTPLPPLLSWTTQFNTLTTLQAGESVKYVIELYLPTSAGNADQNLAAVIDFTWKANG